MRLTAEIRLGNRPGPNHSLVTIQCTNSSIPDTTIAISWEAMTSLFTEPTIVELRPREPGRFGNVHVFLYTFGDSRFARIVALLPSRIMACWKPRQGSKL